MSRLDTSGVERCLVGLEQTSTLRPTCPFLKHCGLQGLQDGLQSTMPSHPFPVGGKLPGSRIFTTRQTIKVEHAHPASVNLFGWTFFDAELPENGDPLLFRHR